MELPSYFDDFLVEVRPTPEQLDDYKEGHETLRERLHGYTDLSDVIVSTFLQGSYRRATAIRPRRGNRSDVDVVVVTRLSQEEYTPAAAMERFCPFLDEYYAGRYELQGRSIRLTLSHVDLDLVVTSAPSEAELGLLAAESVTSAKTPEDLRFLPLVEGWRSPARSSEPWARGWQIYEKRTGQQWQLSPLYIPDREAQTWTRTHPLEQIRWTWEKNAACNGHYVNVVKALKWWRRLRHTAEKYPKGYPLEHIIGQSCPSSIGSVAAGVTTTLEAFVGEYRWYAQNKQKPFMSDHGVPEHDVLHRITGEEFAALHAKAEEAAGIARRALDADSVKESAERWRELFGDKFPEPPPDDNGDRRGGPDKGGFTQREGVSRPGGTRFA